VTRQTRPFRRAKGKEYAADLLEDVIDGEKGEGMNLSVQFEMRDCRQNIGNNIGMAQHGTLRPAGGPRRIEDYGHVSVPGRFRHCLGIVEHLLEGEELYRLDLIPASGTIRQICPAGRFPCASPEASAASSSLN